jgi:hypothetical protein
LVAKQEIGVAAVAATTATTTLSTGLCGGGVIVVVVVVVMVSIMFLSYQELHDELLKLKLFWKLACPAPLLLAYEA